MCETAMELLLDLWKMLPKKLKKEFVKAYFSEKEFLGDVMARYLGFPVTDELVDKVYEDLQNGRKGVYRASIRQVIDEHNDMEVEFEFELDWQWYHDSGIDWFGLIPKVVVKRVYKPKIKEL